jgi:hypothetical protein
MLNTNSNLLNTKQRLLNTKQQSLNTKQQFADKIKLNAIAKYKTTIR